jgi:Caspase domain
MRFYSIIAAALLLLVTSLSALAAGKVALVIGNGAYQNANPLPNPANDATDMAAMLETLGFTVISGVDLTQAKMAQKVGDFEEAARGADVTLFFYAGHGLQVNGLNYLVPIDAKLERASSLQFETIESSVIMSSMSGAGRTAIALIDACRNNPLSRSFSRSLGASRSAAVGQGLAAPTMSAGGMIIGFATAPGDVAADGEGRNSPFTKALLKNMPIPGLEIQQMMTRVKADVFSETKESQEPWHNSSLRSDVYLAVSNPPDPVDQKQYMPGAPSEADVLSEWNVIKESKSTSVFDAFIATHGDSPVFKALAVDRKNNLEKDDTIALLDSLKIPETPEPPPSAKKIITLEALKKLKIGTKVQPKRSTRLSLNSYFDLAMPANEGNTVYALLDLSTVDLTPPSKNHGSKNRNVAIQQIKTSPSIDALLGENSDVAFSPEKTTNCRLDYLDRCPFLPPALVQGLTDAMAAKGLDINNHTGNYYMLSRITNSQDYLLSNSPEVREGNVAIFAAMLAPDLTIKEVFGFDLAKSKLNVDPGESNSTIEVTGAAVNDDDFYISFDGSNRCTAQPRRYGFIAKLSQSERSVKWVSPLNVSDANLLFSQGTLLSANGGSCSDDFLYQINMETGAIDARAKLPSAVERMDEKDGQLTLELYDSAGVYQLP